MGGGWRAWGAPPGAVGAGRAPRTLTSPMYPQGCRFPSGRAVSPNVSTFPAVDAWPVPLGSPCPAGPVPPRHLPPLLHCSSFSSVTGLGGPVRATFPPTAPAQTAPVCWPTAGPGCPGGRRWGWAEAEAGPLGLGAEGRPGRDGVTGGGGPARRLWRGQGGTGLSGHGIGGGACASPASPSGFQRRRWSPAATAT